MPYSMCDDLAIARVSASFNLASYMPRHNIILWEGNSVIDGKPCVAILSGHKVLSQNKKTGPMLQVTIMRSDVPPTDAIKQGEDKSVCGDCIHRGNLELGIKRSCYVIEWQAPSALWRDYQKGNCIHWRDLDKSVFYSFIHYGPVKRLTGQPQGIRWGAYGDPAIIPSEIFHEVRQYSPTNTGYTHQWRETFAKPFKGYLMASCDFPWDLSDAKQDGWHTFSVTTETDSSAGHLCQGKVTTTCQSCKLCSGSKTDVAVTIHGSAAKIKAFKQAMVAMVDQKYRDLLYTIGSLVVKSIK